MVERPSGTVTFLFTDIEGSTRRWDTDTRDMSQALARHDAVLQEAIEANGGWLFKHTGDGVIAAFSSPTAAIEAATAAQRELALPVRMGIATGEAERRGDDYFGPPLNEAARVMGAGHGGQILVSAVAAAIAKGVELLDLGEHHLRDISRAQRIFQVRADGLRESFPPLRTLDTVPGNLPAPLTSFIGREEEVERLLALVAKHRLVTLTGVGGVGKTRLALQVAGQLAPGLDSGAWLVELAPVGDAASVPHAVAGTFGITQQPGMTLVESIAAALDRRGVLLVLDNCEHVIEAVADLAGHLLEHTSGLRLLATSREALMIDGEQSFPVPSLGFSAADSPPAVQLFVERARAVDPAFVLDAPGRTVVREICERLDGIPLAIELAAARVRSMKPGEIRDRLGDRFRLLTGGSRRALERHQTLRQAVQWSYDLLNKPEKLVLGRASVFAGGFTLDAAEAVCAGDGVDKADMLDVLDSLVRKSLLSVDRGGEEARYGLLETIRQLGEEQLGTSDEGQVVRDRHMRFFADSAVAAYARWLTPEVAVAGKWFSVETNNLRAACSWALDTQQFGPVADIVVSSLWPGYHNLTLDVVEWAVAAVPRLRRAQSPHLADVLDVASWCGQMEGRQEEGREYAAEALHMYKSTPPARWPLAAPVTLQHLALMDGRYDEAVQVSRQACALPFVDPTGWDAVLLADSHVRVGMMDEAIRIIGQTAARLGNSAPPVVRWCSHLVLGQALREADTARAASEFQKAGDAMVQGSWAWATAQGFLFSAEMDILAPQEALGRLKRMLSLLAELGDMTWWVFAQIGCILLDRLGQTEAVGVLHRPELASREDANRLEAAVERARAALGAGKFELLRARGRAMTVRQAAAYIDEQISALLEEMAT